MAVVARTGRATDDPLLREPGFASRVRYTITGQGESLHRNAPATRSGGHYALTAKGNLYIGALPGFASGVRRVATADGNLHIDDPSKQMSPYHPGTDGGGRQVRPASR